MRISPIRSLVPSLGALAVAMGAALATQPAASAQASAGACGSGGGNLCKTVTTCMSELQCITEEWQYKAGPTAPSTRM